MPKGVYPHKKSTKKIGASASDKARERCALFIAYCLAKKREERTV